MKTSKKYFTCYNCKITFKKMNNEEWNDEKAIQEWHDLYPETKNHEVDVFCGDCNILFRKWFSDLTEEEKEKMRIEYELGIKK